jgi:hypothetical protein
MCKDVPELVVRFTGLDLFEAAYRTWMKDGGGPALARRHVAPPPAEK